MLSLDGVVSAVGATLGRTEEASEESTAKSDDADPSPQNDARSTLYQCPDCESVYVAIDKEACDTCDTAVEEIPSTLSRTA